MRGGNAPGFCVVPGAVGAPGLAPSRWAGSGIPAASAKGMHAIKRILVPVDFSEGSRDALSYALRLAKHLGASVDVFHAWSAPAYVSPYLAVQINSNRDTPDTLD